MDLQHTWREFTEGKLTEWRSTLGEDAAGPPAAALTPLVFWMDTVGKECDAELRKAGYPEFADGMIRAVQASAAAFTRFMQMLMYTVLYGLENIEEEKTKQRKSSADLTPVVPASDKARVHPQPPTSAPAETVAAAVAPSSAASATAAGAPSDSAASPRAPRGSLVVKNPFTVTNFTIIAAKHNRYGVMMDHFQVCRRAVLTTFHRCFGSAYREEAFTALIGESFDLIAGIILEAQELHKSGKLKGPAEDATTVFTMPFKEDRLPGTQ
jgi:hypothetical protein